MSSFSRGPLPRLLVYFPKASNQCSRQALPTFLQSYMIQTSRSFRTSCRRQLAAPKSPRHTPSTRTTAGRHPPPKANHPPSSTTASNVAPAPRAYANQLALKSSPTVLYEAPSHFWMRTSSLAAGIFCAGYAVINYWTVILHPPEGIAWWVPHGFAVICAFMGGMGAWFILGTSSIVRIVRAVPAGLLPGAKARAGAVKPGAAANAAAAVAAASKSQPLSIEVTLSRVLPLLPARKVIVAPEEIVLPFRMQATPLAAAQGQAGRVLSAREQLLAKKAEKAEKEAARKYAMDHLLTLPFRQFGNAMVRVWKGFTRGLTREGFAKVQVGSKKYRIDVSAGWALDNGRALDRLVTVRPKMI